MSGTLTTTRTLPTPYPDYIGSPGRTPALYTLAWTCTAGGAVSSATSIPVVGKIERVVFVPGTSGNQPTNLYDVTLTDTGGADVLAGQGADLSNTSTTTVCPCVLMTDGTHTGANPFVVAEALTLTVANAGNAKSGTIYLYVR